MEESRWTNLIRSLELRHPADVLVRVLLNSDNNDEDEKDEEDREGPPKYAVEIRPKQSRRSFRELPLSLLEHSCLLILPYWMTATSGKRIEKRSLIVYVISPEGSVRESVKVDWGDRVVDSIVDVIISRLLAPAPVSPLSTERRSAVSIVTVRNEEMRATKSTKSDYLQTEVNLRGNRAAARSRSRPPSMAVSSKDSAITCHLCGKVMKKVSLLKHIKFVHEGEKHRRHPCLECGKAYKTKTELTRHSYFHTGDRPYCCIYCGRTYRENDSWLNCERRCSGNFRHSCSLCGKKFNRKFRLTNHLRVHSGEKPFQCPYCTYQCARKDNLQVHAKKVHKANVLDGTANT